MTDAAPRLAQARKVKAVVVVAKLDRLSYDGVAHIVPHFGGRRRPARTA